MRALGFALILVGVSLIAGSAFLQLKTSTFGEVPPDVIELERALARPGLLGLVTLDVAALLELVQPEDAGDASEDEDSLRSQLHRAGIDLDRHVTHATLALTAHEDGQARAAIAVFGSFEPSAVEQAMRDHPLLDVEPGTPDGVLRLQRIDPETCEESGPFAVRIDSRRVLVAHADSIAPLLDGAEPADASLRDLGRFQAFRGGQLVSAAFFVPDELPSADNFLLAMAAQSAAQQVDGFRAFYAGASPQLLPPGLAVAALFEGADAAFAAEKALAWQAAVDGFREGFAEKLPTLAAVLEAVELHAEGPELHAGLQLAVGDLERLRRLPAEVGPSLFGGMQISTGDEGGAEQLDENPLSFRAQVASDSLAPYDPEVTFASAVDHAAGPVGLRLSAIRLGAEAGRSEIELEAFATGVPNLGDGGERVSIQVTSIESLGGQELLAVERCGDDRNDRPASLGNSFGEVLTGTKSLRLRDGALPREISRILGSARVQLPVKTETVRIPAQAGETVERSGSRLELTSAEGGSISYRVSGAAENLLHLRGLNPQGKPLTKRGSSSGGSAFGSGSSGSIQFAGVVHEAEAVFVLEQEELSFPFELEGARPGTDGEHLAGPAGEDGKLPTIKGALEDWLDELAGGLAAAVERAVDGSDTPLASARTGPFIVTLEGVWGFGGLMPRLQVQAPEIPGIADSPTAIELQLDELHMKDGVVHEGEWTEVLSMGRGFGKPGLVGSAQVQTGASGSSDEVEGLHGSLSIRLPQSVGSRRFDDTGLGSLLEAPGISVRLVELGRDRFTLRASRGSERVLGARAFNGFGEELWVPHSNIERRQDGSVDLQFQVKGVPEAIELRYATELAHAEYPFTLAKGRNQLAQRTR
jgi:hypothetical protein